MAKMPIPERCHVVVERATDGLADDRGHERHPWPALLFGQQQLGLELAFVGTAGIGSVVRQQRDQGDQPEFELVLSDRGRVFASEAFRGRSHWFGIRGADGAATHLCAEVLAERAHSAGVPPRPTQFAQARRAGQQIG